MKVHRYGIQPTFHGEEETYTVFAISEDKNWFTLPVDFQRTKIGLVEAEQLIYNLTQFYGLPVDSETIMNHFVQKMTEPDYKGIVSSARGV